MLLWKPDHAQCFKDSAPYFLHHSTILVKTFVEDFRNNSLDAPENSKLEVVRFSRLSYQFFSSRGMVVEERLFFHRSSITTRIPVTSARWTRAIRTSALASWGRPPAVTSWNCRSRRVLGLVTTGADRLGSCQLHVQSTNRRQSDWQAPLGALNNWFLALSFKFQSM